MVTFYSSIFKNFVSKFYCKATPQYVLLLQLPSWHVLLPSRQWKRRNSVWNLFKSDNEGVFKSEQISLIVLLLLLLTLNKYIPAGCLPETSSRSRTTSKVLQGFIKFTFFIGMVSWNALMKNQIIVKRIYLKDVWKLQTLLIFPFVLIRQTEMSSRN